VGSEECRRDCSYTINVITTNMQEEACANLDMVTWYMMYDESCRRHKNPWTE
jgi:hypothetical protein